MSTGGGSHGASDTHGLVRVDDLVTVMVGGHPQSSVRLNDPTRLEFEYIQHCAAAIDALTPPGRLRVTHVGGAGLTLARWVQHTRPGSPQIVLEPDVALTEIVRRELPLPRGHRIRVRPVAGEEGISALRDASADVVVVDAFHGGRVPADLTTAAWFAQCARVLTGSGLLLMNLADTPAHLYAARVAAGVAAALEHTAYVGLVEVVKRRRFGNLVAIASRDPLDLYDLRRALARLPAPASLLTRAEMVRRHPGARPFTDTDATRSPVPPDPWGRSRRS